VRVSGLGIQHSHGEGTSSTGPVRASDEEERPLVEWLAQARGGIAESWLAKVIQGYSENTSRFLAQEGDQFRNPVGDAYRRGIPAILDYILLGTGRPPMLAAVEEIMRIRSVQDFTASQALVFLFQLKTVLRNERAKGPSMASPAEAWALLDERIDEVVLFAFDQYQRCRDDVYEIKVKEMKRRYYLLERIHPFFAESGGERDSEAGNAGEASKGSRK